MESLLNIFKKFFFIALFMLLLMLGLDEWQLSRIEADVRNTLETAEQAAIIRALDEESFIFLGGTVGLEGMGFDLSHANEAFHQELQRGLHLDNNMNPTKRWLKEFQLDFLHIEMANNYPRVTAGVTVKTKLLIAPLIGYAREEIKAQLADRHTVVWK